jgi:integrase/recombinase XerC
MPTIVAPASPMQREPGPRRPRRARVITSANSSPLNTTGYQLTVCNFICCDYVTTHRIRCEILALGAKGGRVVVVAGEAGPGSAGLHLAAGVVLLRPEEQAFGAMLDGWRNQQLARRLAFSTVEGREQVIRAFAAHPDAFPWAWTPQLVDDWMTDLRAVRGLRRSTLRGYQMAVRLFCQYVTDPAYGWPAECEARFGTHPVQVVHEWNAAVHVQDAEGDPRKRAFTRDELQAFFDHADDQVGRIRAAGRKGWLAAFRDAALFKVAYGYGLRRNEVRMLDVADFGRNAHVPEFGERGVCYVRFGKALKGSPPKPRGVLTAGVQPAPPVPLASG